MSEPNPIRTLIVDDEVLARNALRALLAGRPDFEIVGECAGGLGAVKAIEECAPDLVFLDVEMPMMTGFELIEALESAMPLVVFITAYEQYAVRAFEVRAVDYVLKPFDRMRFESVLARVKEHVALRMERDVNRRILSCLEELKPATPAPRYLDQLTVKAGGNTFFVKAKDLDWIEAEGNYVRLHVGKDSHLIRENIGNLADQLDPDRFARIHRSVVVNLDRILSLHPLFHGDYRVVLRDRTELTLSRNYRKNIKNF